MESVYGLAPVARAAQLMTMHCCPATCGRPNRHLQVHYLLLLLPLLLLLQTIATEPRRCIQASSNLHLTRPSSTPSPPICLQIAKRQQSPTQIPTSSSSIPTHLRNSTEQLRGATEAIPIFRPRSRNNTQHARARANKPSKNVSATTRTRTGTQYPARNNLLVYQEWRVATTTNSLSGDRQDQMQMRKI